MLGLLDLLYLLAAILTSPVWVIRMVRTGKIRTDWRGRFGGVDTAAVEPDRPRVLLHAVSVGEVNAARLLVERLAAEGVEVAVATTTDTGFARARQLLGDRHLVVRYPFDFTFAVDRFLDAVRPTMVALIELEVWPHFTRACARRGIPVGVVNGRLTARSAARYRWIMPVIRPAFRRLSFVAAQNEMYAERFASLGVDRARLQVTGTMKWDTAEIADEVPGAEALAHRLGIDTAAPLVVAGSTAPGEHELLQRAVPPDVQLLCAPRKPEWFDQAASALPGCVRRSKRPPGGAAGAPSPTRRYLLDTIGELRAAYALAHVVVVGRSFGRLHGSDMMEPIALGKATIVGPSVADFQDTVDALLAGDGLVQTDDEGLREMVLALLDDRERRQALAENGRAVIRAQQGATDRNAAVIREGLARCPRRGG